MVDAKYVGLGSLLVLLGLPTNGMAQVQPPVISPGSLPGTGVVPAMPTDTAPVPTPQTSTPQTSTPQTSYPLQQLLDQLLKTMSSPAEVPNLGGADAYLPFPDEVTAKVRLLILLSARRVYVYEGEVLKVSYPIAIGRSGWETPPGKYQVLDKIVDPAWQHPFTGEVIPPGIDNPLGSRWIGFWTDGENFIGFHGTPNPESVGTPASHGCIRMYDEDVVSLFEMVRVGTPVEVAP